MTRVRLVISYDGASFNGFAIQDGVPTVESELTDILEKILNQEIKLTCAGRTDAGVHATGQVVHFDTDKTGDYLEVMSTNDEGFAENEGRFPVSTRFPGARVLPGLQRSLNKLLGPSIVTREATVAADDFDARRSAKSRTYRYKVLNRGVPDPFLARTSWHVDVPLDLAALRLSTDAITGEHDFASFCKKSPNPLVTTKRKVLRANWFDAGNDILMFEVTAYAFCHQMVRALVGTMVEMGLGQMKAGEMAGILRSHDRREIGVVAPPHGLCLYNVEY